MDEDEDDAVQFSRAHTLHGARETSLLRYRLQLVGGREVEDGFVTKSQQRWTLCILISWRTHWPGRRERNSLYPETLILCPAHFSSPLSCILFPLWVISSVFGLEWTSFSLSNDGGNLRFTFSLSSPSTIHINMEFMWPSSAQWRLLQQLLVRLVLTRTCYSWEVPSYPKRTLFAIIKAIVTQIPDSTVSSTSTQSRAKWTDKEEASGTVHDFLRCGWGECEAVIHSVDKGILHRTERPAEEGVHLPVVPRFNYLTRSGIKQTTALLCYWSYSGIIIIIIIIQ